MINLQLRLKKDIESRLKDFSEDNDIRYNSLLSEYHHRLYQLKLRSHCFHDKYTRLMYQAYKMTVEGYPDDSREYRVIF